MKNFEIIELVRRVNLSRVCFANVAEEDLAERLERLNVVSGKFESGVYAYSRNRNDFLAIPDVIVEDNFGSIYYLNIGENSLFQQGVKLGKQYGRYDKENEHTTTCNLNYQFFFTL